MRCPREASRIQRHLTVTMEYQGTGLTNTLFLFLFLTTFCPYKYYLCLDFSIFPIPSLIPYLIHNPSHSPHYLVPVSLISHCPKLLSCFMTFDLCLFPVLPFFPLPWWSPFLHSSQAGSYSMMSCDLQQEGQEHLIDTSILIVFSTTGNWKEKAESKSCSEVWASGKNTSTADRIFEETGKRNTQTILQRIGLRKTFIGLWKRNILSQAQNPTTSK